MKKDEDKRISANLVELVVFLTNNFRLFHYCAIACFDTTNIDQYLSSWHFSHTLKTEPVSYSMRYFPSLSQQLCGFMTILRKHWI